MDGRTDVKTVYPPQSLRGYNSNEIVINTMYAIIYKQNLYSIQINSVKVSFGSV